MQIENGVVKLVVMAGYPKIKKTVPESGQAVVLVLLSLSVVLTVVLFVMARSITDISTSGKQADSVRAFSAAEAGVENALITGIGSGGSVSIGEASYTVDVANFARGNSAINYPSPLISGDTATVWFVDHDADGNLSCGTDTSCFANPDVRFCWGNANAAKDALSPALEISVYYKATDNVLTNLSDVRVARITADPFEDRRTENNFDAIDPYAGQCDANGIKYQFRKTFNFSDIGISDTSAGRLLFAKVRFIYNTDTQHALAIKAFSGTTSFPSQGTMVSSLGTSGQSNRKVNVFQGWPEFPFSGLAVFSSLEILK